MAIIRNKLITKRMPWHANMTEKNHLGAALVARPDLLQRPMTQLFSSVRYSDNPLTGALAGKGTIELNSSEWEWKMKAGTKRPLVQIENVEPESNTTPGKFKQHIKLKLDENFYLPGDILIPGSADKRWQLRVATPSVPHGKGYIYDTVCMWDDDLQYLPVKYLSPGTQWSKLYAQYGEASEQSGSTQYSSHISLKSHMSRYRKHYRVTGDAANEVLAVKIMDSKGNYTDSWVKYAEVEYWEQWFRELEYGAWFSRDTSTVLDANGRPIYSGPGVRQLLEDAVSHRYSILTARLIEEFLMDICYSRIKPGKGRKIVGYTGEYGMIAFHRAITDMNEKRKGFIQPVDYTVQKTTSPYHSNALAAGYQFTDYKMSNGLELTLVHMPLYDDREINRELDEVTGFPIESQRITFLDFTGDSGMGNGNIHLVNKKNGFALGYVAGLQNPYGPTNRSLMSHSGNYYEMHVEKQCGVHIDDITKCGELILSRN